MLLLRQGALNNNGVRMRYQALYPDKETFGRDEFRVNLARKSVNTLPFENMGIGEFHGVTQMSYWEMLVKIMV